MLRGLAIVWLAALSVLTDPASGLWGADQNFGQAIRPVVDGPEGRRAFDDLERFYRDDEHRPPFEQAIRDLAAADPGKRASGGKYLRALLAQSLADETNGRGCLRRSSNSDRSFFLARIEMFRARLSCELARNTTAPEALDAALWLVDVDLAPNDQKNGTSLLCRIQSPRSMEIFRKALAECHPSQTLLAGVLGEVAKRKLVALAPEVRRLCCHHGASVRTAAREAAKAMGLRDLPEYKPEEAFTPLLDRQLKDVVKMVEGRIPKEAKWCEVTVSTPVYGGGQKPHISSYDGWLVDEKGDSVEILTSRGVSYRFPKKNLMKCKESTLQKSARQMREFVAKIKKGKKEWVFGLLGDPLFDVITQREALVAGWMYERGDKKSTAELLFPRLDVTGDDRRFGLAVRELLGDTYTQAMIESFVYGRDYEFPIRLGKHLSQPVFEGYWQQDFARRLADQLARRADDFKSFRLPTPTQWIDLSKSLERHEQINYLAARLRLLNCLPHSIPGNADYDDPQGTEPSIVFPKGKMPRKVINPYVELCKMNLRVGELPVLVPFLADENFMPTCDNVDYGRSTLHQVNWAVADVIREVAKQDLARIDVLNRLDERQRRKHLDAIIDWCRRNASKTPKEITSRAIAEAENWSDVDSAAEGAIREHWPEAVALVVGRLKDFPRHCDRIAEICYRLDTEAAVPIARQWLKSDDRDIRCFAAMILLRRGDKTKLEGLAEIEAILAKDAELYALQDHYPLHKHYNQAVEALLATKNERAALVACGVLKKAEPTRGTVLQLLLAGRKECLDYLLAELDSEGGCNTEEWIASWKAGKFAQRALDFDDVALESTHREDDKQTPEKRRARRQELKAWLQSQFALIKAGKKSDLRLYPER